MVTVLGANTLSSGSHDVANSVRFDDGGNCQMRRAGVASGNQDKFTLSMWIKRSNISTDHPRLFTSVAGGDDRFEVYFENTDELHIEGVDNGTATLNLVTSAKFRDVSAWYHILLAVDTGQGTEANRAKLYINGVLETSLGTSTRPDQNGNIGINTNSFPLQIGERSGYGVDFDGYLAEIVLLDGTQAANTDFGEFDDSGIWKPIDVEGLSSSKGNNGFYLDFEASGNLGNDVFGGTDFSESGLAAIDQTTDTCTNNFATINPLDNFFAAATLSEGNTKVVTNASAEAMSTSTFALSAGRWYFEVDFVANDGNVSRQCGITPHGSKVMSGISGKAADVTPHAHALNDAGVLQTGNGSGGQTNLGTLTGYDNGDVIGVYMDLEDMKSYFSKNGTLMNSGTGINLSALNANEHDVSGGSGHYMFFVGDNNSAAHTCHANFGNPNTALDNAGVTDDNGFGAFEYSPNITGDSTAKKFYACCTKNLVEFG